MEDPPWTTPSLAWLVMKARSVPFSRRVPLAVPRLYRSPTLLPSQISNLYSEMVLLEL